MYAYCSASLYRHHDCMHYFLAIICYSEHVVGHGCGWATMYQTIFQMSDTTYQTSANGLVQSLGLRYQSAVSFNVGCVIQTRRMAHMFDLLNDKWSDEHRETVYHKLFDILLEHGADVNIESTMKGISLLHMATYNKMIHTVRRLLKFGVNPNKFWEKYPQDDSPLPVACRRANLEMVDVLLALEHM